MASGANQRKTKQKRSDAVKKNHNSNRNKTNTGKGSRTKNTSQKAAKNAGQKAAKNSSSVKKNGTGKPQADAAQNADQKLLKDEVRFLLAMGAALLVTMCNFHLCLDVGEMVYFVLHGFFGWLAYLLPFLLLGMYLFLLSNPGSKEAQFKVRLCAGLFLLCCCLVHVIGIKESQPFSPAYYFMAGQSGINGGLVGGLVSGMLQHLIGTVATILIIVLFMLVDVILLTERSVVRTLQKNTAAIQTQFREKTSGIRDFMQNMIPEDERYDDYENEYEEEYGENRYEEEKETSVSNFDEKDFREEESQKTSDSDSPAASSSGNSRTGSVWNWKGSSKRMNDYADFLVQKLPFLNEGTAEKTRRSGEASDVFGKRTVQEANRRKTNYERKDTSFSANAVKKGRVSASSGPAASSEGRPGSSSLRIVVDRDRRSLAEMGFEMLLQREASEIRGSIDDFIVYNGLMQSAAAEREDGFFQEEGVYEEDLSGKEKGYEEYPLEDESTYEEDFSEEEILHKEADLREEVLQEEEMPVQREAVEEDNSSGGYETLSDEEAAASRMLEADGKEHSLPSAAEKAVDVTEHVILPEDGPVVRSSADNGLRVKQKESGGIWKQDTANGNRGSSGAVTFGGKPKPPVKKPVVKRPYIYPPANLLKRNTAFSGGLSRTHREIQQKLYETLQSFGVRVNMGNISVGPSVTRYELEPEPGVKVSRIVALQDDIKLALAASDIRIEAPIPGKSAIGIEVPNHENTVVGFRELIESDTFRNHSSGVAVAVGRDISGQIIVADLAKMPHLLIAGATGSGKSVCINTLIMSIIYKASPEQVKLVMVDPKVVELSVYNGIPHLLVPVVTDARKAANALRWAVDEMNDRYKKFAEHNVRNLEGYNENLKKLKAKDPTNEEPYLYQMVIIVDELADLMMVAQSEVEEAICRLAQMARAAGIHLVLATQRPSVNVITGLIKANVPSRIAFAVSSGVDSRTIIDMNGAEKLLGKGDMLFYPYGLPKPIRVQGAFISDEEVSRVVAFLHKNNGEVSGQEMMEKMITSATESAQMKTERDEYFERAARFIIEKDKASIGALQRNFKIGFNRAARLMDQLAASGIVGEEDGTKPRKILMNMEEFNQYLESE